MSERVLHVVTCSGGKDSIASWLYLVRAIDELPPSEQATALVIQAGKLMEAVEAAEKSSGLRLSALRVIRDTKTLNAKTIREMATDWLAAWEPHCTCANKLRPWHENACPALNPAGPTAAKGGE